MSRSDPVMTACDGTSSSTFIQLTFCGLQNTTTNTHQHTHTPTHTHTHTKNEKPPHTHTHTHTHAHTHTRTHAHTHTALPAISKINPITSLIPDLYIYTHKRRCIFDQA